MNMCLGEIAWGIFIIQSSFVHFSPPIIILGVFRENTRAMGLDVNRFANPNDIDGELLYPICTGLTMMLLLSLLYLFRCS